MKTAAGVPDWVKVGEISGKLLNNFSADPAVAGEVSKARIAAVDQLLLKKTHTDMIRAREMLDELEAKLPGGGGAPAKAARQKLSEEAVRLFARAKDQSDGAQPSGNSVAARNLMRLWRATGEESYRALAEKAFKAFASALKDHPTGLSTMAEALALYLDGRR